MNRARAYGLTEFSPAPDFRRGARPNVREAESALVAKIVARTLVGRKKHRSFYQLSISGALGFRVLPGILLCPFIPGSNTMIRAVCSRSSLSGYEKSVTAAREILQGKIKDGDLAHQLELRSRTAMRAVSIATGLTCRSANVLRSFAFPRSCSTSAPTRNIVAPGS